MLAIIHGWIIFPQCMNQNIKSEFEIIKSEFEISAL
jgi:hypothetical protein